MSLVNVNVPNLLNGVSQQADPLRFVTQGKEQINGMSSIVSGLTKRNGSEYLHTLCKMSIRDRNPYVHFINRDKNEKYVVLMYGGLESSLDPQTDYGHLRIWDINTGQEKRAFNRYEDDSLIAAGSAIISYGTSAGQNSSLTTYDEFNLTNPSGISYFIGNNPKKNIKAFTVADTTFILNTGRSVRTTPATRPASLTNKTVNRVGTTATVNLGSGVSNSDVEIGEIIQVLGTTALAGSVRVTGKPNGTSFTFDTLDVGPLTYLNNVSFEKGERLVPFDMPHTLIRQSDGTFLLERNYWDARGTGTASSNPNPSFVGKKINDIFMYRSRLGFLSDENVTLSENSQFYNFYRTEMSTLLDSDPIDVSTSHSKVTVLHNAVPFSERLVIFSDEAQFYMTAVDILTPKTASIQQTTEFTVDKNVKPLVVGKNIFFPFSRGEYSGIMEYYVTQDTLEFNGIDITSAIPSYIKGNITKIVASNNEQIVAVLTDNKKEFGDDKTLYIYKYFKTEDQKLQSSWSKWEFTQDEKILGMEFIDNYLYLVVDKTSFETPQNTDFPRFQSVQLLKINIQDFYSDEQSDFFVKLDKKFDDTKLLSKSYNSVLDETTFVLPFDVEEYSNLRAVEKAETNRVEYVFDSSPENDALIFNDEGTDVILTNRGTSTVINSVFSSSSWPISLTSGGNPGPSRGTRSIYSTTATYPPENGYVCHICSFAGRTQNTSFLDPTTVHWVIEKWQNYRLLKYAISRPYPDIYASNWESSADPLFTFGTALSFASPNLPQSLPQYPWDVDVWYSEIISQTSPSVTFPRLNPLGGSVAFGGTVPKNTQPRRRPSSTIFLDDTVTGKIHKFYGEITITILDPSYNVNYAYLSVKAKGDLTKTPLWFGFLYDFRYEFSNPMLRLASGGAQRTAVSDGRFQVKNGNLTFNDSISFDIEVTAPFRDKNIYKFSNYTLGRGDSILGNLPVKSGSFRFPVLSRNDKELKVEIVNSTPFPSSFISMDWEAFYSARARRI